MKVKHVSFCLLIPGISQARGGFEVNIDWENGKMNKAEITSKLGNPLKLSYAGKVIEVPVTE